MRRLTRRAIMAIAAGITMAVAPLLPARAEAPLEIGYIPILPMSQLFVMEGRGWTKDAGLDLKLTRFSSGPAMAQALASGKLDVAFFGIGPAMVSRANGIDIKVVAGGVVEQIAVVARPPLAELMSKESAKQAVEDFTAKTGRKPKIASLPQGSVPDTVMRHWILKVADLKLSDFQILGMGASRVQQALLTGAVDAAAILEPILTIVTKRVPGAKVVVRGNKMFPGQPGSVLAVRESVLKNRHNDIETLVRLHVRATRLLQKDPTSVADVVAQFVGRGLVSKDIVAEALTSPSSIFVADPHKIIPGTRKLAAFAQEIGTLNKKVPIDALFDTSIYDAVTSGNQPQK